MIILYLFIFLVQNIMQTTFQLILSKNEGKKVNIFILQF